jgi:hypothetical protein
MQHARFERETGQESLRTISGVWTVQILDWTHFKTKLITGDDDPF